MCTQRLKQPKVSLFLSRTQQKVTEDHPLGCLCSVKCQIWEGECPRSCRLHPPTSNLRKTLGRMSSVALPPSSPSTEQAAPPAGGKSRPSQTGRRKLSLSQSRFLSGALPSPQALLINTNETEHRKSGAQIWAWVMKPPRGNSV